MSAYSHTKLKFRLGLMKLRLNHPILHKLLGVAILILIIGISYSTYQFLSRPKSNTENNNSETIQIKTYSLNGEVIKIENNQITLKADILEIRNGINTLVAQERLITVSDNTEYTKITIKNNEVASLPAKLSDIKIKKNLAIYSKIDPNANSTITADKIEIIE